MLFWCYKLCMIEISRREALKVIAGAVAAPKLGAAVPRAYAQPKEKGAGLCQTKLNLANTINRLQQFEGLSFQEIKKEGFTLITLKIDKDTIIHRPEILSLLLDMGREVPILSANKNTQRFLSSSIALHVHGKGSIDENLNISAHSIKSVLFERQVKYTMVWAGINGAVALVLTALGAGRNSGSDAIGSTVSAALVGSIIGGYIFYEDPKTLKQFFDAYVSQLPSPLKEKYVVCDKLGVIIQVDGLEGPSIEDLLKEFKV